MTPRLLLTLTMLVAFARAGEPESPPLPGSPDRVTLQLRGAALQEVVSNLARRHRLNVVSSGTLTGTVDVDLYDVRVEEALEAVLAAGGLGYQRRGVAYRILPLKDLAAEREQAQPLGSALLRPAHIDGESFRALAEKLLSPRGQIKLDAGGRAILLVDTAEARERVSALLAEVDRPPRQVLVESTILDVTLSEANSLGINLESLSGIDYQRLGGTTDLTKVTSGAAGGAALDRTLARAATTGLTGASDGFSLGIVKNAAAVFIRAVEDITDVNVLAHPKVLAVDGREATIIIGQRLGYRTTTTSTTATVENVEFLDVGTQLRFTPFIDAGGAVRMRIHPEQSTGQIDANGLPQKNTTELTSEVMVRSGQTIVLGGLIDSNETTVTRQVPFLGSLPLLGNLFRSKTDQARRREIIVLLSPRLVDLAEPDDAARRATERFERVRARMGEALSPQGRRALIERAYRIEEDWRREGHDKAADRLRDWRRARYRMDAPERGGKDDGPRD